MTLTHWHYRIKAVPTLEGELFRQWRESYGISRQDIMDARRPKGKAPVGTLKNHETKSSSMSIDTLLTYIRALEAVISKMSGLQFKLGETDTEKLIAFFQGHDAFERDRGRISAAESRRAGGRG